MNKILTWDEAEELSGISRFMLKKAVKEGALDAYWVTSQSYGVTAEDLENYIKTRKVSVKEIEFLSEERKERTLKKDSAPSNKQTLS